MCLFKYVPKPFSNVDVAKELYKKAFKNKLQTLIPMGLNADLDSSPYI